MNKRRILLINPRITSNPRFPLAVMSLAAAMRERHAVRILDGNVDPACIATALQEVREGVDAVGITVMGGPQLPTALAMSRAIRAAAPHLPIIWGGYFPTICPDAALKSDCVDHVVRGQGEDTFLQLLDALFEATDLAAVEGLSWRQDGKAVHNRERKFSRVGLAQGLCFDGLENPQQYVSRTYLGRRTTGYQAALGCRYRCTFCGVAAMFKGKTALPTAERLDADLHLLKTRFGVDSINFYDHNFFDREVDMQPLLETLARHQLPWWCFARSDAIVNMSEASWALVRKSQLRMAYIGAESPNDQVLHDMRKGTRSDQTLAAVEACRRNGVVPELSFMLAPPQDPEGETERSFEFIRAIKRVHPGTEITLYVNTPLHNSRGAQHLRDAQGRPVVFPDSAEGWAEKRWLDYWCHQDAPWVSEKLRQRIQDFTTVLGCRFPTITDVRTPRWQKAALRATAAWRYRMQRYDRPQELQLLRRVVRLWDPRVTSL